MNIENKDYLEVSRDRYTEVFKGSDNFDNAQKVFVRGKQELQENMLKLMTISDIDLSSGVQLDVIGEIVGQPRELFEIESTRFFGFEGDSTSQKFGTVLDDTGGIYYSLGDPLFGVIKLGDSIYRTFLKAKIIQNNSKGSIEDVIQTLKLIFNPKNLEVIDGDNASVWIYIGRPWNDAELTVFPGIDETEIAGRLLPIPAGVSINYVDYSSERVAASVQDWNNASYSLFNTANAILPSTLG